MIVIINGKVYFLAKIKKNLRGFTLKTGRLKDNLEDYTPSEISSYSYCDLNGISHLSLQAFGGIAIDYTDVQHTRAVK